MKTINLPEGNAFGVDDDDDGTPYVTYAEQRAKTLFFVWVTLSEHKWVTLGERRGQAATSGRNNGERQVHPAVRLHCSNLSILPGFPLSG
jgi:hypothetical protein